jgi:hypothetical protein
VPPPARKPAVVVHYRAGSSAARRAAGQVAEEARRAGFAVAALRAMPAVPSEREVRHPDAADATPGEELGSHFRRRWGKQWRVRGPPGSDVPATAGTSPARALEVWLPHR